MPRGVRWPLVRRLAPFLCRTPRGANGAVLEFVAPVDYARGHGEVARLLERPAKPPPASEAEFLASLLESANAYPGSIGPSDSMFLTAVVGVLAPVRVIELGTASGFSAAVIAAALARQGVAGARVDTIDLHPRYYADPARPVGYAVEELVPALVPMVRMHTPHGAEFAAQIADRDTVALAFIDANHQHPCPVLDLLLLAPVLKSRGWVLLHDVRLGTLGREAREAGREMEFDTPFGAEWLYEEWPWRKFRGQNIGAIQLPDDKAAIIAVALQLMERPFETSIGSHRGLTRDLHQSFPALLL